MKRKIVANILDAWSPLENGVFRAIFLASLVSNVGSWMQNTAGSWLMTSLTKSSLLVALMQTAASLPLFFFSLPAGSLADIVDRRKILLYAQIGMLCMAVALSTLTFLHMINPWTLMLLTFAMGIGNAFNAPAWLAAVPETVEKKQLGKALALNSVSYNVSLAIGPAIAGIILSRSSPGWIFLLNALSFVAIIAVLFFWKHEQNTQKLPAEKILSAMKVTIRYIRNAPQLQNVLIRSGIFITFGSTFWALLPSIARFRLHMDAGGFGMLYGSMGIGSLAGATIMPKLQQKYTIDTIIAATTVLFAIALGLLGFATVLPVILLAMFFVGVSWIIILSTFNMYVQTVVAYWVKARAIGVYILVVQGGLAIGSVAWGAIATRISLSQTVLIAVVGSIVGLIGIFKYPLAAKDSHEIQYSDHWPQPPALHDLHPDSGPVLVSVNYTIQPKDSKEFMKAAKALGPIRRRSGSKSWGIFRDTTDSSKYIETFITDSWLEHLRQHQRLTLADKAIEDRVTSFHTGEKPPEVTHYLAKQTL